MSILITRPTPYGNKLTHQLNAMGKKAWHLPLITFTEGKDLPLLQKQLNELSNTDLLFVMSQTAIYYAHSWLLKNNISWPKKINYYAIGHNTAIKTKIITKKKSIIYPKIQKTSEALLQLPELNKKKIKGKKALILCGNKGRKILKKTLEKRGVKIMNCESYSHIPLQYNGEKQTQHMIKLGINTILITSNEILQHLYNLIPKQYKKTWLIKCHIIVISHRIAKYAKKLGWNNITIIQIINHNTLINTLLKIQ